MNSGVHTGAHRFVMVEVRASAGGSDPVVEGVSEVALCRGVRHQGLVVGLEAVIDRYVEIGVFSTRVERSPRR
jgi:hypothetical protein